MRIHRYLSATLCAAGVLILSGCIQSSTLIKLKPDGSGTIEQTMTMTAEAASQFAALSAMGDQKSKAAAGASNELFSEADARNAIAKMGSGVTYVSSEKIDTPERKGRKAIYAFPDIRKILIEEMASPPTAGDLTGGASKSAPMKFSFAQLPGGHSLLTIAMPDTASPMPAAPAPETASAAAALQNNAQAMEMMKMFLKGLQIEAAIQVDNLVKTNSPYVSGGTVTLISVDFDKVLADSALLERMQRARTLADTKGFLKDAKGFKVMTDPTLTIEFTGARR